MRLTGIALFLAFTGTVTFAADADAGKALFATKCKVCHGATGQGNAGMAKALKVELLDLGSPDVQKLSDAELKKDILNGCCGTTMKMKPMAVSATEADNLVAFIRTLKK